MKILYLDSSLSKEKTKMSERVLTKRDEIRIYRMEQKSNRRKGCDHTEGHYHNCEYVEARNKFIDRAAEIADDLTSKLPVEEYPVYGPGKRPKDNRAEIRSTMWNKFYFEAMDTLFADSRKQQNIETTKKNLRNLLMNIPAFQRQLVVDKVIDDLVTLG